MQKKLRRQDWLSTDDVSQCLDTVTDASVYALATMTTLDVSGLAVPARFQMLSALQAVNGVLLFGISTAFLFAVLQVQWRLLSHRDETHRARFE